LTKDVNYQQRDYQPFYFDSAIISKIFDSGKNIIGHILL